MRASLGKEIVSASHQHVATRLNRLHVLHMSPVLARGIYLATDHSFLRETRVFVIDRSARNLPMLAGRVNKGRVSDAVPVKYMYSLLRMSA
jgi:hypothetical protein